MPSDRFYEIIEKREIERENRNKEVNERRRQALRQHWVDKKLKAALDQAAALGLTPLQAMVIRVLASASINRIDIAAVLGVPLNAVDEIVLRPPTIHGTAHPKSKLDPEKVKAIREARKSGKSFRGIASDFGVSTSAVCKIVTRKTWKHVP